MALIDDKAWLEMAESMGIKPGFALSMAKLGAEASVMTTLYGVSALQKPGKKKKSEDED